MQPWLERFNAPMMARILKYEKWLESYGIMPISGMELEFAITPRTDVHGNPDGKSPVMPGVLNRINSPYIERFYRETGMSNGLQIYEVVIGAGKGKWKKPYPHLSLRPSVIARAAEAEMKIIEREAHNPRYRVGQVSFDTQALGHERLRGQHSTISLWNADNNSPLFLTSPVSGMYPIQTNMLLQYCGTGIVQAQHAFMALVSGNPQIFKRYPSVVKQLKVGASKMDCSVAFRKHKRDKYGQCSCYLENRLSASDESPYFTTFITLAGLVHGLNRYMQEHGITSPEQFKQHIASPSFSALINQSERIDYDYIYQVPTDQREALHNTEFSPLARSLLGGKLHKELCRQYELNIGQHNAGHSR